MKRSYYISIHLEMFAYAKDALFYLFYRRYEFLRSCFNCKASVILSDTARKSQGKNRFKSANVLKSFGWEPCTGVGNW